MASSIEDVKENADIDRETPQPEIHVEERKLGLHDFLKTLVRAGGSDLHLQASSTPTVRVDGRAGFRDCPAPTDEAMKEYVDTILKSVGESAKKREILET